MRTALAAVAVLLTTACSGPEPGARITAPPQDSRTVTTTPTTTTSSAAAWPSLGQASDIKAVDWRNVRLSAEFCAVDGLVQFRDSEATAHSATWGQVHLFAAYDPDQVVYGDLDGDGRDEAAVDLGCDNGSGTAGGQLGFGYAIVTVRDGALELIGEISATTMRDGESHVPLVNEPRFEQNAITVSEAWYRDNDATCCPSGLAQTTWRLVEGKLVADPAVQIS